MMIEQFSDDFMVIEDNTVWKEGVNTLWRWHTLLKQINNHK